MPSLQTTPSLPTHFPALGPVPSRELSQHTASPESPGQLSNSTGPPGRSVTYDGYLQPVVPFRVTLWLELSPEEMQSQLEVARREQTPLTWPATARGAHWECSLGVPAEAEWPPDFTRVCEVEGPAPVPEMERLSSERHSDSLSATQLLSGIASHQRPFLLCPLPVKFFN